MTYYPPPRPRHNNQMAGAVLIIVATAAVMVVALCALVAYRRSHPEFSPADQSFLAEVHHAYTWPGDKEVADEGHRVCAYLSANGGVRAEEQLIYSPPVSFMWDYSPEQRSALVDAAEHHFCPQFSLKINGIPV